MPHFLELSIDEVQSSNDQFVVFRKNVLDSLVLASPIRGCATCLCFISL